MKTYQITERNKAEKLLRFVNYLLDLILSILIIWAIIFAYAFIAYFVNGIPLETTASSLENMNGLLDRVLTILMYAIIMFATEKITEGRSLGKYITGTMVVKLDGSKLSTEDLLKRNFSRAVPFDSLSFLGNNGWHDSWSDTRVVKKKSYENEIKSEKEILEIGNKETF